VLHEGGRELGWAALAARVVNVWRPLWAGPSRAERLRWLAVTVLCVLVVPALKQFSLSSCPWDLAEFGGVARYVPHWQSIWGHVADGGPGRCFPSGHAAAAFAFIGGWFVLAVPAARRTAGSWACWSAACCSAWASSCAAHYPTTPCGPPGCAGPWRGPASPRRRPKPGQQAQGVNRAPLSWRYGGDAAGNGKATAVRSSTFPPVWAHNHFSGATHGGAPATA
jgi:hypothetical protein